MCLQSNCEHNLHLAWPSQESLISRLYFGLYQFNLPGLCPFGKFPRLTSFLIYITFFQSCLQDCAMFEFGVADPAIRRGLLYGSRPTTPIATLVLNCTPQNFIPNWIAPLRKYPPWLNNVTMVSKIGGKCDNYSVWLKPTWPMVERSQPGRSAYWMNTNSYLVCTTVIWLSEWEQ